MRIEHEKNIISYFNIFEAKRVSSTKFEIVSGLKEGDVVVNNSLFLIDSDVLINGEE